MLGQLTREEEPDSFLGLKRGDGASWCSEIESASKFSFNLFSKVFKVKDLVSDYPTIYSYMSVCLSDSESVCHPPSIIFCLSVTSN